MDERGSDKKRRANNLLRLRVKKHRAKAEIQKEFGGNFSSTDEDAQEVNLDQVEQIVYSQEGSTDDSDIEPNNAPNEGTDHEEDLRSDHSTSELSSSSSLESEVETSETTDDNEDNNDTSDSDTLDDAEIGRNEDPADEDGVFVYYDVDGQQEIQHLKEWAIKHKIHLSHMDELLGILRVRLLPDLPKCAKTFLGTTGTQYNIIAMQDKKGSIGEFVYLGVTKGLKACINPDLHSNNVIELQVNVDEVLLVKSGYQEFCPILCKVHCDPDVYEPFAAAIYFGESKPADVNIFLQKFVNEINKLQQDGIVISGRHFEVIIKCFICDTPARAFLKSTVGHNGKNACERCTVEGFRIESRTVFPSVDTEARTNESFRARSQPDHHHGVTTLLHIVPFLNIISVFLLDSMHLLYQGITKKLLKYWVDHGINKLPVNKRQELSRRMKLLKRQVPCEFQRKPRSTDHVDKWKATELRFFSLYAGPVVLKDILISKLYKHFLLFHVACRFLCSDKLCSRYWPLSKEYLQIFFQYMGEYYEVASQILNAHHLIHLPDVYNMGCSLSRISAFPFENLLRKMKKYLRTPFRPLAQLCHRLHEECFVKNRKPTEPPLFEIIETDGNIILKLKYKNFTIMNAFPDNIILMKDKNVVRITNMRIKNNNIEFRGKIWEKKKSIFTFPVDSRHLNMWQLKERPSNNIVIYSLTSVKSKLVCLSINMREEGSKKVFVIPFLHD